MEEVSRSQLKSCVPHVPHINAIELKRASSFISKSTIARGSKASSLPRQRTVPAARRGGQTGRRLHGPRRNQGSWSEGIIGQHQVLNRNNSQATAGQSHPRTETCDQRPQSPPDRGNTSQSAHAAKPNARTQKQHARPPVHRSNPTGEDLVLLVDGKERRVGGDNALLSACVRPYSTTSTTRVH